MGSAAAGGPIPIGLNPHQRGLVQGFFAGIAEGVADSLSQPAAEAGQTALGRGVHGVDGEDSPTLTP